MLKAEIISTGNEILNGELVDTNSTWIAEKLTRQGIRVVRKTSVGDEIKDLSKVLKELSSSKHLAIVTGGLGPTSDDITAQAAASAANTSLETDPRAVEQIRCFFQRIGGKMSETNKRQALLPLGSNLIENPIGSAPGFSIHTGNCLCFFLPGVPAEMKKMFEQTVLPKIREYFNLSTKDPYVSKLRIFGLGESQVEEKLSDFQQYFPGIELGYRAIFPELQLSLKPKENTNRNWEEALRQTEKWIISRLGQAVYSCANENMEEVIGKILTQRKETLAIAESCTGGKISHLITNVSGSSSYFLLSGVSYANEVKMKMLQVSASTLQAYGAVSPETAREMAAGIRKQCGATYAISTSGIAGPSGGTPEKPVGTVCIGIADSTHSYSRKYNFDFQSRTMNKKIFAFAALDLLRRHILNIA